VAVRPTLALRQASETVLCSTSASGPGIAHDRGACVASPSEQWLSCGNLPANHSACYRRFRCRLRPTQNSIAPARRFAGARVLALVLTPVEPRLCGVHDPDSAPKSIGGRRRSSSCYPTTPCGFASPADLRDALESESVMTLMGIVPVPDSGLDIDGRGVRPCQRMPASISGTSLSIDAGVTTPAPVLSAMPGIRYFFDSTHCNTGTKPCR
jgi:hypothetical protein